MKAQLRRRRQKNISGRSYRRRIRIQCVRVWIL